MNDNRKQLAVEITRTNWYQRLGKFLGLERNTVAASAAVLLLGFGEELWSKFLPKYMEALGAGAGIIGLFKTAEDFFDALYQYPGGWLADHLGRRLAFVVFIAVASVGYIIYLVSPSWPYFFLGLAFAMAWHSMASPAIFAVIADALPREQRAMGFSFQAIIKRVPRVISPLIGGALIASIGIAAGIRAGLAITLALAALTVLVVLRINIPTAAADTVNIQGVWRTFHSALKRLLISDIIVRTCEGLSDVFVILYATNITHISMAQYGVLLAVQVMTAMLVYIPSARLARRIGRKSVVIATFTCFACFPFAVIMATGFASLALAFIIGGLREIGEPSRKAMIVDFAEPRLRARTVGLYYLVRSLTVTPAAALGGLLWKVTPVAPFIIAGLIGLLGTVVFALTVEERHAG
ncbi:MAG: MFS transporter [Acidobacteria bacterium]|nr:MFS transporter [Acidobacteriota bacterium]